MQSNASVEAMLVCWPTEDGGMRVSLNANMIASAGAGGLILADLARHFARALSQVGLADSEDEALNEICQLFAAEMNNPTDLGEGSIVN